MSSCPNENKIVAFAQGSLGEAAVGAIERHLDHCRDCATVLCDAAAALDVVVPDDEQDTPVLTSPSKEVLPQHGQLLPQGTGLGRYVVLDLLGTGGLGCVYAAYDPELDRRVAVKILQPRAEIALAERAQPMLKREAQALAKLAHPNVVPVHDVGTIEDRVFIAMELVRGPTLREWLKQERRTWQQVRDVFVQAGRGLLAAHRAGLVHRDFKPTNVLLAEDDRPQVVDFGLARAVSQVVPPSNSAGSTPATPVSSNQDLTGTGSVVGTPAYMAPEQLRGGAVDARADQFAFCVTMYEALYGQRPFQAQGLKALEQLVTSGHIPDPPPGRSVPAWLRRAITVGLRPDPARRYASMAELLRAIAADLHSKRRQWLALAAAVACTAVVTVLMTLWVQPQPTPRQVESVQEMASQARAAAQRARYLYPPVDAPESPTALSIVYQLEQLDGSAQELGVERAEELRREFSTALAHLGDEYWERSGGATFASDYYAAAVIFWPANEHAKSRLYLTLPQLAHLTQKAQTRDFTRPELVAAEVLAALAEPDLQLRRAKVERLTERSDELPATIEGRLGELVGIAAKPVRPPAARPASALPAPTSTPASDPIAPDSAVPPEALKSPLAPVATRRVPPQSGRIVDRAAAVAEVRQGDDALLRGRPSVATAHFHRALQHDRSTAAAQAGLAEVHFQQGNVSKAIRHGVIAVRLSPKSGRYHFRLGDAYLKVARYDQAREQYQHAKRLGHAKASKRLTELERKLGRP